MILQALYDYYRRKASDPDGGMAPPGFEWKEIPLVVSVNKEGDFVSLEDTREGAGRNRRAKRFLVPQGEKRPGSRAHEKAFLLWDSTPYVFGIAKGNEDEWKAPIRRKAFMDRIRESPQLLGDGAVRAVLRFLESGDFECVVRDRNWPAEKPEACNVAFKLAGEAGLITDRPSVYDFLSNQAASRKGGSTLCLVTGALGDPAVLHPPIKGVYGAQSTGANIVSFNLDAFRSFGKEQGANAPVSEEAAFAYTTALNHLLERDSRQKLQVGDATTVFWAEKSTLMESLLADLFNEPTKDDPDRGAEAVRALYRSPEAGTAPFEEDSTRFYVLGLSPNAARISIRFWYVSTVGELAANIKQHFEDLELVRGPKDPPFLPIRRLLLQLAPLGKADHLPPSLGGDLMRALLSGAPYPTVLLQSAVRRLKSEQGTVTHTRAALIKACLNREGRHRPVPEKELRVSLDPSNANSGYRLGRLFAVLEKAQEEASPGINATIRDRYYGSASSNPVSVFPILMRLKNHHLSKLENRGRAVNLERLIGEILEALIDFPSHLNLGDQGRFAVGYYHQRQDFFRKPQNTE